MWLVPSDLNNESTGCQGRAVPGRRILPVKSLYLPWKLMPLWLCQKPNTCPHPFSCGVWAAASLLPPRWIFLAQTRKLPELYAAAGSLSSSVSQRQERQRITKAAGVDVVGGRQNKWNRARYKTEGQLSGTKCNHHDRSTKFGAISLIQAFSPGKQSALQTENFFFFRFIIVVFLLLTLVKIMSKQI